MAAKRSPILGYNHNVRFRGIVFHIQTEDSGIINPHVFTHLFHGGVIISTRKLVYDPDANDEAVKALMQAQHKAVMKDLKRGTFDDKIDQYLGGTEGLLPRESAISVAAPRPVPTAAVDEPVDAAPIAEPVATPAASVDATPQLEIIDALSEPIELPLKVRPPAAPPADAPELDLPAPPLDLPAPAMVDDAPSAEIEILGAYAYADAAPEDLPVGDATIPIPTMPEFAPRRIGDTAPAPIAGRGGTTPPPVRVAFNTADAARAPTEQVPPAITAALDLDAGGAASHKNDVSAAMRAIQVTDEELSAAGLSEMAEIHSPAPPSAPAPPGAQPERAGSYHLGRKTGVVEAARPPIPRPSPTPAPPRPPSARPAPPPLPTRTATPVGSRVPTPSASPSRGMPAIPQRAGTQPRTGAPQTPTPPSNSVPRPSTAPGSGPSRGRPASGGGVVVSRPAVIVGGKGAPTTPPAKPRRAREAEGFGGDLISERSLDEVILAYLSEDTNDE
ncbi:MAG: hypothetical protein JNK64_09610 [Myxococcales bacterium]|nr:hypothetical protein [Myxococcales bacterium]